MPVVNTRFDLALCYVSVLVASATIALPWVLCRPLGDIVADYTRSNFNGKPLPPITDALLVLRPYCLVGAPVLVGFLTVVGISWVRSSRQPIRTSLLFLLAAVVLTCLAFTFVSVALVVPFVRLFGGPMSE